MWPTESANIDLEQIFAQIQTSVYNALPENWLYATLTAEIDDDTSGLTYGRYCLKSSPNHWQSFDTDYTHYIMFDALRQRIHLLINQQWRKAVVEMSNVGEFRISFTHNPASPSYT